MSRRAFIASYCGSAFPGWQTQVNGKAIQDVVQGALSVISDQPCKIVCAGRTDAGVHALKQVFHVDISTMRPDSAWVRGVNALLPSAIAILNSFRVSEDFHARFSALGRTYRYVIERSSVQSPMLVGRAGWVFRPLDVNAMRIAAALLIGEHDFSSFRSSQCQSRSPIRTIFELEFAERGSLLAIQIRANAFLHHMIRNIVGALVEVGTGRRDLTWFRGMFLAGDRRLGAPTFSAAGLYFVGVDYEFGDAPSDFITAAAPIPLGNAQW